MAILVLLVNETSYFCTFREKQLLMYYLCQFYHVLSLDYHIFSRDIKAKLCNQVRSVYSGTLQMFNSQPFIDSMQRFVAVNRKEQNLCINVHREILVRPIIENLIAGHSESGEILPKC